MRVQGQESFLKESTGRGVHLIYLVDVFITAAAAAVEPQRMMPKCHQLSARVSGRMATRASTQVCKYLMRASLRPAILVNWNWYSKTWLFLNTKARFERKSSPKRARLRQRCVERKRLSG